MAEGRRSAERAVRRAAESLAQVSPEADASFYAHKLSTVHGLILCTTSNI